jgi:hypothetical protein
MDRRTIPPGPTRVATSRAGPPPIAAPRAERSAPEGPYPAPLFGDWKDPSETPDSVKPYDDDET